MSTPRKHRILKGERVGVKFRPVVVGQRMTWDEAFRAFDESRGIVRPPAPFGSLKYGRKGRPKKT